MVKQKQSLGRYLREEEMRFTQRPRFSWTSHQLDKLNKVQSVIQEWEKYKPLTIRQIFYQLVVKEFIENRRPEYTMLSVLLKWARIDGRISWDDIEDRSRIFHNLSGWGSRNFITAHLQNFLKKYQRDLMQSQDVYLELWVEKDALSSIFTRAATPYTVSITVNRGFSSISFLNDYRERVLNRGKQRPVVLFFSDFDPSGKSMMPTAQSTLKHEMGLKDVEFKRIALLKDDIETYQLPHNLDAIKKDDTRSRQFVKRFGEVAVELDALPPNVLTEKIKSSIEAEIDMGRFRQELNKQKLEVEEINGLKDEVYQYVQHKLKRMQLK